MRFRAGSPGIDRIRKAILSCIALAVSITPGCAPATRLPKGEVKPEAVIDIDPARAANSGKTPDAECNSIDFVLWPQEFREHIRRLRPGDAPGVDLTSGAQSTVIASEDGQVVRIGYDERSGYSLSIAHGFGFMTTYGRLLEPKVRERQLVRRGDVVGIGGSGGSTPRRVGKDEGPGIGGLREPTVYRTAIHLSLRGPAYMSENVPALTSPVERHPTP